jgi:hypothetical protein
MAAAVLWPFRGRDVKFAGDLHPVVNGIAEARNALAAGQFPLRIAPNQWDGAGYPFFQYYGNFPYTLAGALDLLPGIDAYTAWKILTFTALVAAGIFTSRCAMLLTGRRHRTGAIIAGAAFIAAPYMLTDIFARGLLGEVIAFCLLPLLLYTALKLYLRPRIHHIITTAVVWALIGLTHNITYFYASIFLALFFLSLARINRRSIRRCLGLTLAAGIQAALVAWYFVPQIKTLNLLNIGLQLGPFKSPGRAPLGVILAPTLTSPPGVPGTALGIQVGWPILAGVLAAFVGVFLPRKDTRGRFVRAMGLPLLLLFLLALFMAWSPFDFWRKLPRTFSYVQFPYRLLMFCVLWGSLLIAIAIRQCLPHEIRRWQTFLFLAAIGLAASTYRPGRLAGDPAAADRAAARPTMSGLTDYRLRDTVPSVEVADVAVARVDGVHGHRFRVDVPRQQRVRVPVLYYPGLLRVRVDKETVPYKNANGFVAVDVPGGVHGIDARFVGVGWANALSLMGWIVVAITLPATSLRRSRRRAQRGSSGARSAFLNLFGFGVFLSALRIGAIYAAARDLVHPPVKFNVTASRQSPSQFVPQNAFDGDRMTEWAATGSDPITLTVNVASPQVLQRAEFESRGLGLYEGWQHVRVELFRDGKRVAERDIDMPHAWRQRTVAIELPATAATHFEFHFSSPVTKLLDGKEVGRDAVSPGYSEIRLLWAKR